MESIFPFVLPLWLAAQDSPKDSPGDKFLTETSPAEAEVSEKPPEAEPVEDVVESSARFL